MTATQRAGGSAYLDLFAGPGQVRMPTGVVIDGSPLIAAQAKPSFSRLFWSDADPRNAASLRAHHADFPDRHIDVLEGDANALIDGILTQVSRTHPALAFLDPEGSELAWETVRKISVHKPPPHNKIEQFILFATDTGIVRFFPRDPSKLTYADRLDRMLPDPVAWRGLYALRDRLDPAEFRRRLLGLYVAGMQQLGYRHVPEPRLVCRPDGRPLYFMVFERRGYPLPQLVETVWRGGLQWLGRLCGVMTASLANNARPLSTDGPARPAETSSRRRNADRGQAVEGHSALSRRGLTGLWVRTTAPRRCALLADRYLDEQN